MGIREYAELDATELARLVQTREVSAAELMDEAIRRLEAVDPRLNLVVHRMYDRAREAAARSTDDDDADRVLETRRRVLPEKHLDAALDAPPREPGPVAGANTLELSQGHNQAPDLGRPLAARRRRRRTPRRRRCPCALEEEHGEDDGCDEHTQLRQSAAAPAVLSMNNQFCHKLAQHTVSLSHEDNCHYYYM